MNSQDTKSIINYMRNKWLGINFPKDTINEMIDYICNDIYEKYPMTKIEDIKKLVHSILKEKKTYYYLAIYQDYDKNNLLRPQ
jgi:hypothetical protein